MLNARLIAMLTAAMAVAGIPAGCGGDGGSDSGSASTPEGAAGVTVTTSSLSKPEFIKRASAACVREGRGVGPKAAAYMARHAAEGASEGKLLADAIKEVILPSLEAQSAAVRKLGAPAGDEATLEAIFAAQRAGIDELREQETVSSIGNVAAHFAEYNEKLEDYGFTACVYG